jgi:hypothetical protein
LEIVGGFLFISSRDENESYLILEQHPATLQILINIIQAKPKNGILSEQGS